MTVLIFTTPATSQELGECTHQNFNLTEFQALDIRSRFGIIIILYHKHI